MFRSLKEDLYFRQFFFACFFAFFNDLRLFSDLCFCFFNDFLEQCGISVLVFEFDLISLQGCFFRERNAIELPFFELIAFVGFSFDCFEFIFCFDFLLSLAARWINSVDQDQAVFGSFEIDRIRDLFHFSFQNCIFLVIICI